MLAEDVHVVALVSRDDPCEGTNRYLNPVGDRPAQPVLGRNPLKRVRVAPRTAPYSFSSALHGSRSNCADFT